MDGDDELKSGPRGRRLLALRVACAIGVTDSLVALTTAIVARPWTSSVVLGIGWVLAWTAALATVPRWAAAVRAHVWWLAPLALVALLPAARDGGYPGNLATQPQWIALVAAAAVGGLPRRPRLLTAASGGDGRSGWRRRWALAGPALACGAVLSAGKLAIFLATGTPATTLAPWHGEPSEATTATLAPIAIALLGCVGVTVLRRVQAASAAPGVAAGHVASAIPAALGAPASLDAAPPPSAAPQPAVPRPAPPPRLSPAERAVVGLLADGLTPKQIAHARGTSVETVRTQIKRAKRATAARTLDELVASAWRPR